MNRDEYPQPLSVSRTIVIYGMFGLLAPLVEFIADHVSGHNVLTFQISALRSLIYLPSMLAIGFVVRWFAIRREQRTAKRLADLERLVGENQPDA